VTRRLLVSYLSLTLLVLLTLEIPLGLLYTRGETDRFLSAIERDAVVLAENAEEAIENGDVAEVPDMLAEYARDTGGHAVVVDPDGIEVARSAGTPNDTDLSANPDIAAALRNQRRSGTRATAQGIDELYVTVPATSGQTIRGALRITYPATAVTDRAAQAWWILTGVGLAVLLIAAAVAFGLARWMTRPVRELEAATTRLASGSLDTPPPADLGPPELRRLAATFADTAGRLQHLIAAQRAFAADASHQLKTPLTALRLRLENLEPALDPRALPSLDEAVAETDRLTRMVQGLLALARLEDAATDRIPVDVDGLVADRAASWAPFAAEHDVALTVTGPTVGQAWAAPHALDQILDNLLANALRAAPAGSTVTINRRPTTDGIEIHVIDQGAGMSAADRQRAFDRFWRAPDASDDGSGLGLAIVAQLVRASGGHITLEPAPRTGIDAAIRLQPIPPGTSRTYRKHPHATGRHTPPATNNGKPADHTGRPTRTPRTADHRG